MNGNTLWHVYIRNRNCGCLEEEMPDSVLANQGKYPLYSAQTYWRCLFSPQFGEGKVSLIFCMLLCGLPFLKILLVHESSRNQELFLDWWSTENSNRVSHGSVMCVEWWQKLIFMVTKNDTNSYSFIFNMWQAFF